MESTKEDKLMESNDRLLKLRRTRNKIDVIRILECVWVDKKCSHLLDPNSMVFRVLDQVKTTSPNADGVPEEKTESISRPALNLQDWMLHHPKIEQQIAMEKEVAVIRKTLELAMGSDFLKTFHEDSEKANVIMRSLLPYPAAATNDQLMATLVQNQQAQQRTLDSLVQALQNLQTNRGSSNGLLLAAGAPPVAPAAAPAADQQAMFINQPTFNPADLHRRFPDEEKAGTSDSYGFQQQEQGYDVYGSDDEA